VCRLERAAAAYKKKDMRALLTLVLVLVALLGYGQTVGGAGWCKTSANPNTITSLRVVNQKNMCSNVWDTLARKMYYYDYALTVGSRWVEFIPLTPPIGAETVVTAGTGISVTGIGSAASPYVVTNTGDLSTTNEIQHVDTLLYTSDTLRISLYLDGRPQKKVYIPQSPGGIYGTSDTTTGNHIATIAAGKTLTIRSQGDNSGGVVPFRIESNGSEPDIAGFYANGDSLLISRSDTESLIHASNGITIMADGVLGLVGDSILLNAVGPALSSEKTFLQITPGGYVKYTEGVSLSQTNLIPGAGIAFAGDTIKATGGGLTYIAGPGIVISADTIKANDTSPTNEIQSLSLSGQALGISGGGAGVTLPVVSIAAGAGISVSTTLGVATVTNTGDTNAADDLTGSGTTNYLPKWTGSTALGNSLVFDNGTNIGVGTTSPSKLLHVEGDTYINGNIELPTTTSTVGSIIVNNQRAAHFFNSGTFVGLLAGNYTQTGIQNTGIGQLAARALTTGSYNSAFGYSAGELITSGYENTAFSRYALGSNTTGYQNVAVGSTAMYGNVSGAANTGIGYDALRSPSSGNYNTAIGANSLNSGGASISDNTAIGASSGFNAAGSGNVFIGKDAGYNETGSNTLYIDNSNTSTPLISGDFSTNRVGINVGVASLTQALNVSGNARVTGAYYDSNNDPGSSVEILSSTVTGTDWVAASTLGDNWGSQAVQTTGLTLAGNGTAGAPLQINTNGVTALEIAADAVGSSEIATDAVGSAEIAANAVGSSELAATTVTAGTYGSATQVPVTTFDADGRATGVTNTTITGTLSGLTATRIPFASGAAALIDDALLTWNNTTKRMSIGNTGGSPQAALHIAEGSVASFEAFRAAATVSGNMLFTLTNANNAGGASNNILTQNVGGSAGGDPLHQYVVGGVGTWVEGVDNSNADKFIIGYESTPGSGSDWLTISTTGQVGIQNNAPAHALDVTGRMTATLYQGKVGTPTHTFGTGAGTTPTLNSLTGTSNGIDVQFTTGTTPSINANIISITYPTAFTTTTNPVFCASNAQTATDITKFYVSAANATAFTLTANGTLSASTTYRLRINISGR